MLWLAASHPAGRRASRASVQVQPVGSGRALQPQPLHPTCSKPLPPSRYKRSGRDGGSKRRGAGSGCVPSAGHCDGPAGRKAVEETLHFAERTWLELAVAMPGKSVASHGQYFQGEEFTKPQRKWRIYGQT